MQWAHRRRAAMLAAGGGTLQSAPRYGRLRKCATPKRLSSSVRARPVSTAAMHAIRRHQDRAERGLGLIAPQ